MRRLAIAALIMFGGGIVIGVAIARGMDDRDFAHAAFAATTAEPETTTRTVLLDPNGVVDNRYFYAAGTEALGPDEIRVVACGTGMPAARRGQAAACRALLEDVGPQSETALHYHADGYAPLHRCCFGAGNVDTLRVFLEAGIDPALASIEDRAGRGGRPGTTCEDVATSDEVKELLAEYSKEKGKGRAKRRGGGKGGRKGARRKKKAEADDPSVEDILAQHPDL